MWKRYFGVLLMLIASIGSAAELPAGAQTKIDAMVKEASAWATDPVIVEAVRAQNKNRPADFAAMTQQKWAELQATESFVRSFTKNPAAEVLKAKRTELVTEAFVSDDEGIKVGFLAKPTNWSHKGKPKHEVPMSGKPWQGQVETDESTGFSQVQISVPVMDAGKPIGSLVVGLNIAKL
jgi:hypothetical protein